MSNDMQFALQNALPSTIGTILNTGYHNILFIVYSIPVCSLKFFANYFDPRDICNFLTVLLPYLIQFHLFDFEGVQTYHPSCQDFINCQLWISSRQETWFDWLLSLVKETKNGQ